MGLLTWIVVAVVVLAIVGLGAGVFFSGVIHGASIIGQNPTVKNATMETKQFIENKAANLTGINSATLTVNTDKTVYGKGEPVLITVKNNGDKTLIFPDSSMGMTIKNTDTGQLYGVVSDQTLTPLDAGQSKTITWKQQDSNGNPASSGNYVVTVHTSSSSEQSLSGQVSFSISP